MTLQPGVHFDIPDYVYHGDPAPMPSLSVSIGKMMLETCPGRGRYNHPRLNPLAEPFAPTLDMEEGSALHRLILGAGQEISIVRAADYKKDIAKEARRLARRMGMVPVLEARHEELKIIARRVRAQLAAHPEACRVLDNSVYASEVTIIWQEDSGCYCRIRVDRAPIHDPSLPMIDFKFTSRLKSPLEWDRVVWDSWWDMRAAFYTRGSSIARDGVVAPYQFIVVEKESPSDLFVMQLTPHFMAIGERRAEAAIDMWERCTTTGEWPAYPARIFHIVPPPWAEARWFDRPPLEMMFPAPVQRADAANNESLLGWLERNPPDPMAAG